MDTRATTNQNSDGSNLSTAEHGSETSRPLFLFRPGAKELPLRLRRETGPMARPVCRGTGQLFLTAFHIALFATSLSIWTALTACAPEFDDETQSLLKKPEIISVVLDKPEAAPGEQVTASFLLADEKGPLQPPLSIWLPLDLWSGPSENLDAELQQMGLTMEDLVAPQLTLTVKPESAYTFDEEGLAYQGISLVVQIKELPADLSSPTAVVENLQQLLDQGAVKVAQRTLIVSSRADRKTNPEVAQVTVARGTHAEPVQLFHHDAPDLKGARQNAAQNALVLTEKEEVHFEAQHGGAFAVEALRYQWISTGGDFQDRRLRRQPWTAPAYQNDSRAATASDDPREDPNLHPVWLILRNTGVQGQLGQSWVEFYARIEPAGR